MLSFYKNRIFYPWMSRSISTQEVMRLRREIVSQAFGTVLEIGYGTGLNLDQYSRDVRSLIGIDTPIPPAARKENGWLQPELIDMSAEKLDFTDETFDCVVSTFTLCSISDLRRALREVHRVLKRRGRFLFLEHGRSWKPGAVVIQTLSNPLFWLSGCGCQVTRDYQPLILQQGFNILSYERYHLKTLPIAGYLYLGCAVK